MQSNLIISSSEDGEVDLIEKQVGSAIRSLRKMRGLTRKDLADILHVSHQQVAKYENAQNRITAGKLFKLASTFNVSLDYFFGNNLTVVAGTPSIGKDRDQIEVAKNYMNINSYKKREAVRLLTRILAEEN
jgi:transcriptional regulator with XRE-family HTH domain